MPFIILSVRFWREGSCVSFATILLLRTEKTKISLGKKIRISEQADVEQPKPQNASSLRSSV